MHTVSSSEINACFMSATKIVCKILAKGGLAVAENQDKIRDIYDKAVCCHIKVHIHCFMCLILNFLRLRSLTLHDLKDF